MEIKFLTLNILNGKFLDKCIEFLKKESPDIFVLQEVYKGGNISGENRYRSFEIIRAEFKDYFYFFTPEFYKIIDGSKVDEANVIFSRFPLFNQTSIYYSNSYGERRVENPEQFINTARNLQYVQIKTGNKIINVFNTHGVWGADGKDNEERLKMSKVICGKVKGLDNVILAGDFNVEPDTRTIKNMETYLKNIFKGELKTTFNMKVKTPIVKKLSFFDENDLKGFSKSVVDMIFVSLDVKVVDHYCPKVDVSDHFPLVTILEI